MWEKIVEMLDPHGAIKSTIMKNKPLQKLQFKIAISQVKCIHKTLMKHRLHTLKFCLINIARIGIPTSKEENETLKRLLALYDDTIKDMDKDLNRSRNYLWD